MLERKHKKVVLVNPPLSLDRRYGQLGRAGGNQPPLGLCYLASAIRRDGFDVTIIDAQARGIGPKGTTDLIRAIGPRYVGITASSMAIDSASELARLIKIFDSSIKIIIGGSHVSSLPAETLREYGSFDVGVVGEGEDTFKEVLSGLDGGINPNAVRGVVIREGGRLRLSQPRPRIKNLDDLPYPAFELLADIRSYYRLPVQSSLDTHGFSLVTSRGCFGKCSFCDRKVFGNDITMHSAGYIAEMIFRLNKDYAITNIMFEDDNFMVSKQRLRSLADLLNKEGLKIRYTALARVDCVDEESLTTAKDMGCWQVSYGIESGCQRILDFYKKGVTISQIRDAIELTKKVGLKIKCFFMWGNPTEDQSSVKETAGFIESLGIDDISITFFTPYPGSEVWGDIKSYGNFDKKLEKMSCFESVFTPYGLEKEDLVKSRKEVLKNFYFRPKVIFSYLKRVRSIRQLKELILSACCLLFYILKGKKDG